MPKDKVYDDATGFYLQVSWRREDHGEALDDAFGRVRIGTVNPESVHAEPEVTLNEYQLDFLITVLRKARRQAFPVCNTVTSTEERFNALHKKELDLRFEHSEAKYELRVAHRESMKAKQKAY